MKSPPPGVFLAKFCFGGVRRYALREGVFHSHDAPSALGESPEKAEGLRDLYPRSVLGIGANHPMTVGEAPSPPAFFAKSVSALIGDGASVLIPDGFESVIAEAELVAVVGNTLDCANVATAQAAIAGYAIGNDLTALPVSMASLYSAKASRGLAPIGRRLLHADLGAITLGLSVNGHQVSSGDTSDLYLQPWEVLSQLSHLTVLRPGDLVFTGAVAVSPPLVRGDRVSIEAVDFERIVTAIA